MNQDLEHLKLLSVFHYVVAGLGALIACFPFIHFTLGVMMVTGSFPAGKTPPPPVIGWALIAVASLIILSGWTLAACIIYAGRCLARRTHYTYCIVIAALACALCSPFGTVLGIFTLIVLLRPSVKVLFGQPVQG